MHSIVYELSRCPLPASQWATPGFLPDWFFCSVCDYAVRQSALERARSIRALAEHFGPLCQQEGDRLWFSPLLKRSYFRERHRAFLAAARALSEISYDAFAGLSPAPDLPQSLQALLAYYEDRHGFYVYLPDDRALVPLDRWLRTADLSQPVYVGGTIGYYT